ncbi:MAG: hypothetical protein ACSW75_00980 [Lachnospiraceae bacterium]
MTKIPGSKRCCEVCIHKNPYQAKNCMLCPEADVESLQTNVVPLHPSVKKPSRSPRRLRIFAVSAAIGCFVLGSALLAGPLTEQHNARLQEEAAAKEAEEQALASLWTDFFKVQDDEGRDSAIAWLTELAEEEKTKDAAGTILNWCRRNGPEQIAFKKAFEVNGIRIGIDGATALLGESYNTYIKSGDMYFHGGNIFSVEYVLSNNATFEATLFIPEDAQPIPENSTVWDKAKVTILGSGGRVLATYKDFSKRDGPLFVCVPVHGEQYLKIVFENCSANGGILGFELMQLVVLGDPVLTPAPAEAA